MIWLPGILMVGTLFGLPLHPILVNFTAALIPLSFFNDLLARIFRRDSLATAGWWMLLYGTIITPVTALSGWWWYRDKAYLSIWDYVHFWLGFGIMGILVPWAIWRGWYYRRGRIPGWGYLIPSLLLVGAMCYQGHQGGDLTFHQEDYSAEIQPPESTMPQSEQIAEPSGPPAESATQKTE